MMKGIILGGFNVSGSTQMAILVVFVLYSVIVVGLGFFVKYNSGKGNAFSDFLTGGGGLNSLEVAIISATTIMGGGVMVSGPGLVHYDGFVYALLCLPLFLASFVALGTYGKKLAIIQKRLHAQTVVQCIHHRYQSRGLTMMLVACMAIFMTMLSGGQFLSAAKVFGTFWKKATTAGGYAACASGFIVYVVLQLLSKYQSEFYNSALHAIHSLIPALLISMLLMVVVSLATQDKKVPLGVYRVWFCKDYDDKYTQIYNSCSLGWKGTAE